MQMRDLSWPRVQLAGNSLSTPFRPPCCSKTSSRRRHNMTIRAGCPPHHPTTSATPSSGRKSTTMRCILGARARSHLGLSPALSAQSSHHRWRAPLAFSTRSPLEVPNPVHVLVARARLCARGFILALAGGSKSRGNQFAAVCVRG